MYQKEYKTKNYIKPQKLTASSCNSDFSTNGVIFFQLHWREKEVFLPFTQNPTHHSLTHS